MIKPTATAKTKAIRMPGKERPAASRLGIQWPPTTKSHHRHLGRKQAGPSDSLPRDTPQRVLDHRFLSERTPCPLALDHSARRDPGGATIN